MAQSLLSKSSPRWRVVLADISPEAWEKVKPTVDTERSTFIETDVGNWESQASMFERAYEYSQHKIDFFHANAGTGDRELVWQRFNLDAPPQKPNLDCLDVNIIGVFYGLKLFTHYTRKTRQSLQSNGNTSSATSSFQPKFVITASSAGIYPFTLFPQYAATKAACVNLARSAAPTLMKHDGIGLNCIMPAFVPTRLNAQELVDRWPPEYITPTSTVCRAIDELISETGTVNQDGKSDGKHGQVKVGQSVEIVVDRLYYRTPQSSPHEAQKFALDAIQEGGLWNRVYAEIARERKKRIDRASDPRKQGKI